MLLLLLTAATFHTCTISVGTIFSCEATSFTGKTVARGSGDLYRECSITNGEISTCGHPFTGKAVIPRGTKYRECQVEAGRVATCKATGFNGKAVVRQ